MPKRKCKVSYCRNMIDYSEQYCEKHKRLGQAVKHEAAKQYNQYTRYSEDNKRYAKFYQSKEWKAIRKEKLLDQPLCEVCLEEGTITQGTIVHHKIEIKDNWEKRLDMENLETICQKHHNKHHKKSKKKLIPPTV